MSGMDGRKVLLTDLAARWEDSRAMNAPRTVRGGGWRKSGLRATIVALVAVAFIVGQQVTANADDPLQQALKQKEDLARAVAQSRANVERYKDAASQFQAAVNAANSRIADLSEQEDAAQSQADALALEIQIREEQLALVSFQMTETKALADSLNAQAAEERQQLTIREDLYAKHLRTTYRQALISPLEMLLSSKSLTDFATDDIGRASGCKSNNESYGPAWICRWNLQCRAHKPGGPRVLPAIGPAANVSRPDAPLRPEIEYHHLVL